jgi:UDP:flavonoid glycosyltransferase YjiC (YdhE family)
MRFLIASTPALGHLNPLLQVGRLLKAKGHEIIVHTASWLRPYTAGLDAEFIPLLGKADFDTRHFDEVYPEFGRLAPGAEQLRFLMEDIFIEHMPEQYTGLRDIARQMSVDAIIADRAFLGTIPMLLDDPADRPAVIHYGFTSLYMERKDGAPTGPGLPPANSTEQEAEYRALRAHLDEIVAQPALRRMNARLQELGIRPLEIPVVDAMEVLADLHLQPTVPSFEYPLAYVPANLVFVGALPPPETRIGLPAWAGELGGFKKTVLVTQGTFANQDLGQLIAPTLAALADEPNILVVVTTGGRELEAIPGAIPDNARVAEFLPFKWLLPRVDLVVTNGGYGTVNMALKAGIPLVVAGLAADKTEIATRIAWSGAGINLATDNPDAGSIRAAVRRIFTEPAFRAWATRFAAEFAEYDTEAEILNRIVEVTDRKARVSSRPRASKVQGWRQPVIS